MKFLRSTIFKILVIAIISFLIILNFDYSKSEIIKYSFILSSLIDLFSISLAIIAILFTLLDRYKNLSANKEAFTSATNEILKEMSEDSISLFFIICLLFISELLKSLTEKFKLFDIYGFLLIFSLILILFIVFDISFSIIKLVNSLQQFRKIDETEFSITESEKHLIEAYRKLDKKHSNELLETIKTLIIKQNIDKK